jgi:hypothetical protein
MGRPINNQLYYEIKQKKFITPDLDTQNLDLQSQDEHAKTLGIFMHTPMMNFKWSDIVFDQA